ncbi:hypothetical protein AKO1_007828 [Acrasis kona]|uniref:Uncharacterized protein n=1 Tax=Acrasis kona TaxID=1008807 RepID=A0AAW2YP06_9EUKA
MCSFCGKYTQHYGSNYLHAALKSPLNDALCYECYMMESERCLECGDLKGKNVLVIDASTRLGSHICKKLMNTGCRLIMMAYDEYSNKNLFELRLIVSEHTTTNQVEICSFSSQYDLLVHLNDMCLKYGKFDVVINYPDYIYEGGSNIGFFLNELDVLLQFIKQYDKSGKNKSYFINVANFGNKPCKCVGSYYNISYTKLKGNAYSELGIILNCIVCGYIVDYNTRDTIAPPNSIDNCVSKILHPVFNKLEIPGAVYQNYKQTTDVELVLQ